VIKKDPHRQYTPHWGFFMITVRTNATNKERYRIEKMVLETDKLKHDPKNKGKLEMDSTTEDT
jgi:hypothetical protein